ncbi:MAG: hypothetical protein IPP63_17190 [Chloracidobacterium sp.]|nr:hypothetical protein [Chloracidobacterium sp.]
MAILRKRQIENLEQMNGEQLDAFLNAMPAGQESMSDCSITSKTNSTTKSAITHCVTRCVI